MTSKAALFALLAIWGVGAGGALPARADDGLAELGQPEARADAGSACDGLVNRVWRRCDGNLPAVVRIFLSDGTLVMDDSWETHRLSNWSAISEHRLTWSENGRPVTARIAELSPDAMTLAIEHNGQLSLEHYRATPLPGLRLSET